MNFRDKVIMVCNENLCNNVGDSNQVKTYAALTKGKQVQCYDGIIIPAIKDIHQGLQKLNKKDGCVYCYAFSAKEGHGYGCVVHPK